MSERISMAIAFGATAHAGQVRKYTGEPYILHPIEVMGIVREFALSWTEDMLIAAVLHDVVEDTPVSLETIERRFGKDVAMLVDDLTDKFMDHALGNRRYRKGMERQRLGMISDPAKTIKLADLISNTRSIVEHDLNFATVYLAEKAAVLPLLVGGDAKLASMAQSQLTQVQSDMIWRKK